MTGIQQVLFAILLIVPMVATPARAQVNVFDTMLGIGTAIMLEEARRNGRLPSSSPNGSRAVTDPETRAFDQSVVAVQSRLNALGFDAGPADGIMGRRTAEAIAAFQRTIGSAPTGVLTLSDRAALFGGGGSVIGERGTPSGPNGTNGTFDIHYDMDLPGNDFRSGMTESGLRDIELDTCMRACEADGSCNAFTYNSRARVCFLKIAGTNATPFAGAISGTRSVQSVPSTAITTAARPLTSREIGDLQAALNGLGYNAGTPDGVAGSQTRAAIARFLAEHPGAATSGLDTRLYQAVLGSNSDVGSPGMTASTDAPIPVHLNLDAYADLETLTDTFERIAIALDPTLLDDLDRVKAFFDQENGSLQWDRTALGARYQDANIVEREAILREYAARLQAESEALFARIRAEGLRLSMSWRAPIGEYVEGRGLRLGGGNEDLVTEQTFRYWAHRTRTEFVGLVLDLPDVSYLPQGSAAEASATLDQLAQRSMNGLADLTVYLTISAFGTDENVGANAVADPDDVPVTVRLDQVALTTVADHNRTRFAGGEIIHVFGQPARDQQPTGDAVAIASANGLPVVQNHVVWPTRPEDEYYITRPYDIGARAYRAALTRFLNLAAVGLDPSLATDLLENKAVRSLLSPSEHLRIFGQQYRDGFRFENSFAARRAADLFAAEVLPALVERAPAFPLDVVTVQRVHTERYDFATASFPIEVNASVISFPDTLRRFTNDAKFVDLPASVPVPADLAEALVIAAGKDRLDVYVATFGRLEVTSPTEQGYDLTFVPRRVAVFADAALTHQLLELSTANVQLEEPAEHVPAPAPAEQRIAGIVLAEQADLLRQAYHLIDNPELTQAMVESSRAVERANEFEIAQALGESAAQLAQPAAETIWVAGELRLGTYDLAAETFSVEELEIENPPGDTPFRAQYDFVVTNPEALSSLAVAPEPAREIIEERNRRLPVLLQIRVSDVRLDPERKPMNYEFAFGVEHLVAVHQGRNADVPVIVADTSIGSADQAPQAFAVAPPPITELTNETLDYLRLVHAPHTVDDGTYLRMMVARWQREQKGGFPQDQKFFPDGIDLTVPAIRDLWQPRFVRWADARAAAMGTRLTLAVEGSHGRCTGFIDGERWTWPLHEVYEAVAPELGASANVLRSLRNFKSTHIVEPVAVEIDGYDLEADGCVKATARTIEAFALPDGPSSGAVVMLEQIVAPGTDVITHAGAIGTTEFDIEITAVEVVETDDRANPPLLIRAEFVGGRYPAGDTVIAYTAADLEALAAATAAPDLPDNWDIVGLRPGQTLVEAEAIIRDHMTVVAVYEGTTLDDGDAMFLNRRSYVADTLGESITLVYEPTATGDVVFAISRRLGQPARTMPLDAIIAGLRAKYGEESEFKSTESDRASLRWVLHPEPQTTGNPHHECGSQVAVFMEWRLVEGDPAAVPADVPDHIGVRSGPWLPMPLDSGPGRLETAALDCGASIQVEKSVSGGDDKLLVQLIDFAGYQAAWTEARALAADQAATAEAVDPAAELGFEF